MDLLGEIKAAVELAMKAGHIELARKLMEAQKEALDLMEQNIGLREENSKLKKTHSKKEFLRYKDGLYWSTVSDDPGPFCPRCFDAEGLTVHLRKLEKYLKCTNCLYRKRIRG